MSQSKVKSGSIIGAGDRVAPYDAMVYQDGTYTIAVDGDGNVIKKVLSSLNTDDVAIQAAIDKGNVVEFLGDFVIKNTLMINSDNVIYYGNRSKITLANSSDVDMLSNTPPYGRNVSLHDISFDGNKTNQSVPKDIIRLEDANSWKLHNVTIGYAGRYGFYPTTGPLVRNYVYDFDNCKFYYGNDYAIYADVVNGLRVINSYIETNYGGIYAKGININIHHNYFDWAFGTNTHHIHLVGVTESKISNNYIMENGVAPASGNGIFLENSFFTTITGNTIRGIKGTGIRTVINSAGTARSSGIIVNGNSIRDCTGPAIYFSGYNPYYLSIVCANNSMTGSAAVTVFDFGGYSTGLVRNNYIRLGIVSVTTSHIMLKNNVFDSCTFNIGTYRKLVQNLGYTTESTGKDATISAGNTYVDVTHSLNDTPTTVRVTPTTNLGTRSFWVDTKGASTFRININSSDLIDHTFDWEAEV